MKSLNSEQNRNCPAQELRSGQSHSRRQLLFDSPAVFEAVYTDNLAAGASQACTDAGQASQPYRIRHRQLCCNKLARSGIIALAVCLVCGIPNETPLTADQGARKDQPVAESTRVRLPAVAGLFYPKDPTALRREIDNHLRQAKDQKLSSLRALIVPHAGYQYSGPTAAYGYKQLQGKKYKTVIVLAPSHYAMFKGASVCGADAFETPLGRVPISPLAKQLAKQPPFVPETPCRVQRPAWARQASKVSPPAGEETPHTWEHSDEVQIPFLQVVLGEFAVVPIIFGSVDPGEVARALADKLDEQTLLVASSDLSHYYPYERAKELDKKCVEAICRLDVEAMAGQEACGKDPILCVMHIARQKGWMPKMLDYRNSGDTAGDKSGVVGYTAIAFETAPEGYYSKEDRKALLQLARKSLIEVVTNGRLPNVNATEFSARCSEEKGCFVTLTKKGVLRGCIGNILPNGPLWKSVMENARNAALRDYRFPPVQKEELNDIEIEISVLTVPQPLKFDSPEDLIRKLRPHKDGVVLELGLRSATYLPQVWEQLPEPVQFLSNLSMKAGGGPDDWRRPGTKVLTYQVEAFKESEM